MKNTIRCPDCHKDISWEDYGNERLKIDRVTIYCPTCRGLWNQKDGWYDNKTRLFERAQRFLKYGNESIMPKKPKGFWEKLLPAWLWRIIN
jgi:endogenous inhibitor of DNA gyrase (YacG/DUF329 family)